MSQQLHHKYATDGTVKLGDIRESLAGIGEGDLSVSSPVTAGAGEVSLSKHTEEGGEYIVAVVAGHDGDWTKTSEQAVRRAIESTDGVAELVESEGGYDG